MGESNIKGDSSVKSDSGTKTEGYKGERNTKTESKSVGTLRRFLSRREKLSSDPRQGWFFNFDKKKRKGLEDERKV